MCRQDYCRKSAEPRWRYWKHNMTASIPSSTVWSCLMSPCSLSFPSSVLRSQGQESFALLSDVGQMLHLRMQSPPTSLTKRFLLLCNFWVESKLEKHFFHTKSRCVPFLLHFRFCWTWKFSINLPKLDTTPHLLFWDCSGQGCHRGLVANKPLVCSIYLNDSLSWN